MQSGGDGSIELWAARCSLARALTIRQRSTAHRCGRVPLTWAAEVNRTGRVQRGEGCARLTHNVNRRSLLSPCSSVGLSMRYSNASPPRSRQRASHPAQGNSPVVALGDGYPTHGGKHTGRGVVEALVKLCRNPSRGGLRNARLRRTIQDVGRDEGGCVGGSKTTTCRRLIPTLSSVT